MRIKFLLLALLTMLTCGVCSAEQTTQIKAAFTPAKVVPGEVTTYAITLVSTQDTRVSKITPPDWSGLELISSTQSASTTKGKSSTKKLIWKYRLKAPAKGTYTVSGASVDISQLTAANTATLQVPSATLCVTGILIRHSRPLLITALFLFAVICAIPVLKIINRKNRQARKKQKDQNKLQNLTKQLRHTSEEIEVVFTKRTTMTAKDFFKSLCLTFDRYEEQITLIEEKPARSDSDLKEIVQIISKLREETSYMGQQTDLSQLEILHKKIKRYFQNRLEQTN